MSEPQIESKEWSPDDCWKGVEGCFCRTGYAYEDMCPDCRDKRWPEDRFSYCACPPPEDVDPLKNNRKEG